uniref:Ig-like domain-containing protein n=1 Tax=Caenorhabditis japonica TaxID=281687 RepID=A0A8R1IHH9_CAEJA
MHSIDLNPLSRPELVLVSGSMMTFTCDLDNRVKKRKKHEEIEFIEWFVNGKRIKPSWFDWRVSISWDGKLGIWPINEGDSGIFECLSNGQLKASVNVVVVPIPRKAKETTMNEAKNSDTQNKESSDEKPTELEKNKTALETKKKEDPEEEEDEDDDDDTDEEDEDVAADNGSSTTSKDSKTSSDSKTGKSKDSKKPKKKKTKKGKKKKDGTFKLVKTNLQRLGIMDTPSDSLYIFNSENRNFVPFDNDLRCKVSLGTYPF